MDNLKQGKDMTKCKVFKNCLFIYGCTGSLLLLMGFSLVEASRGLLSRCGARASHCSVFSCFRAQPLRACGFQQLQHAGLVAPWHVESSWTKDQTRVPFIGRQILNHWTTREILPNLNFEVYSCCFQLGGKTCEVRNFSGGPC